MANKLSLLPTLVALVAVGCAPQVPYRPGKEASEYVMADGSLCGIRQDLPPSRYRIPVAYVEIDEQGYFQDRGQVKLALELVGGGGKPKYVVVYIHGRHHNASQTDGNVRRFKCALSTLQEIDGNVGEDVIGIYIGWRGDSLALPVLRYVTFWDRKNTSEEVGRGSLVEFLTLPESGGSARRARALRGGARRSPAGAAGMRQAARRIQERGLRAPGITAIFSPLNPSCEDQAAEILREECPDLAITRSPALEPIGLLVAGQIPDLVDVCGAPARCECSRRPRGE